MRRALILLAALGLIGLSACGALRPVVRRAMTPRVSFDPSGAPAAPDYSDPAAWSALPERQDAGDAVPAGLPAIDQSRAPRSPTRVPGNCEGGEDRRGAGGAGFSSAARQTPVTRRRGGGFIVRGARIGPWVGGPDAALPTFGPISMV